MSKPKHGSCGDSVEWMLDDGTITISGSGSMLNYSENSTPWYDYWPAIKNVVVEKGVLSVGNYAFYKCTGITSVTMADVQTIGNRAFAYCDSIHTLDMGGSVKTIRGCAFYMTASSFESLYFPESVKTIGDNAFKGTVFRDVYGSKISATASELSGCMFYGFGKTQTRMIDIRTVIDGPSTCHVSGTGFYPRNGQVTLTAEPGYDSEFVCWMRNGEIVSKELSHMFVANYDTTYTAVFIQVLGSGECGDGVSWILYKGGRMVISGAGDMFDFESKEQTPWHDYRLKIKDVVVGNGVLSIGNYAFYGCTNIVSMVAENVQTIGNRAFARCSSLESLDLGSDLTRIMGFAFYGCSSIERLVFPDTVESIGSSAFKGATFLDTDGSVLGVSEGNMAGRSFLRTEPSTYTALCRISIAVEGPTGCAAYAEGSLLPGSEVRLVAIADERCRFVGWIMGDEMFSSDESCTICPTEDRAYVAAFEPLSPVVYSDHDSDGNRWALYEDGYLVVCGDGPFCINYSRPWAPYISSIKHLVICEGTSSIEPHLFSGCDNLLSVKLPASLSTIGIGAFDNCSRLIEVCDNSGIFNSNVESLYSDAEGHSILFADITQDGTYYFAAIGESLELLLVEPTTENVVLPSSVYHDGSYFDSYSIHRNAFLNCVNMSSVIIPESVSSIGENAFLGCRGLVSVVLPDSVTSIGQGAFMNCTGLISINIPDSVHTIESSAFLGCYRLVEICCSYLWADTDDWVNGGLMQNAKNVYSPDSGESILTEVEVADGSLVFAKNEEGCWLMSADIYGGSITLPSSVDLNGCYVESYSIHGYAFSFCENLTSIVIPDSVTIIGYNSFHGCTSLESIYIGKSAQNVQNSGLKQCPIKHVTSCVPLSLKGMQSVETVEFLEPVAGIEAFDAGKPVGDETFDETPELLWRK